MRMRVRNVLVFVLLILIMLAVSGIASANGDVRVEHSFQAENLEYPEGIAIDKEGNIYVSLGPPFWFGTGLGEVWMFSPDGTGRRVVEFPGGPGPAGLAVDAPGNLYIAYPTSDSRNGVYRLDKSGNLEKMEGSDGIWLANGLAFDKQGDLYVSDSAMGAVWRIPTDGSGSAEIWFADPWLAGCFGIPGANGIAYRQGSFYVANTAAGSIIEIPVLPDGSPGTAQVVAGDADCVLPGDELFGLDGIALDVHGDIYAALVIQNQLVKIDLDDGSSTTLLTEADGLYNPASLAFGTGKGERQRLFFTNFAVLPPEPAASLGPAILSLDVDVPGQPLP
jgi:sugar lactone lactonase YvrE